VNNTVAFVLYSGRLLDAACMMGCKVVVKEREREENLFAKSNNNIASNIT